VVLGTQCSSTKLAIDFSQPENIILDEETGNVKVVDFGAVQDVASSTLIGSTVVGTVRFSCSE
jgi:serine/threonine protein kinase